MIGAGALVGQALVRAVGSGAAELQTWRAIGTDNKLAVRAMVAPAVLAALIGALTTIVVAVLLSPRFPIGYTRQFELDVGLHADWLVLLPGAMLRRAGHHARGVADGGTERPPREPHREQRQPAAGAHRHRPPAGDDDRIAARRRGRSRETGGAGPRRAPGAVAGVLTVVACLTFRNGLADTVNDPARSGIVWDHEFAARRAVDRRGIADGHGRSGGERQLAGNVGTRRFPINGTTTPVFGVATDGGFDLTLLRRFRTGGAGRDRLRPEHDGRRSAWTSATV